MAFIEWDDSFSVNHPELDAQHRKWVEIINELHAGLDGMETDPGQAAKRALVAMMDYARHHFLCEEKYMREINFPDTILHIKVHNDCYGRIASFLLKAEAGGRIPVTELLRFLRGWLLEHILLEDRRYSLHAETLGG
jgi:hemerythrin-like metal-binding protein